jgi:hypothetical protein
MGAVNQKADALSWAGRRVQRANVYRRHSVTGDEDDDPVASVVFTMRNHTVRIYIPEFCPPQQ